MQSVQSVQSVLATKMKPPIFSFRAKHSNNQAIILRWSVFFTQENDF